MFLHKYWGSWCSQLSSKRNSHGFETSEVRYSGHFDQSSVFINLRASVEARRRCGEFMLGVGGLCATGIWKAPRGQRDRVGSRLH